MCEVGMATNLQIDDALLNEALEIGGKKTKKQTVTDALIEYIQRRRQIRILDIFKKIDIDPKYNYKKQRLRNSRAFTARTFIGSKRDRKKWKSDKI